MPSKARDRQLAKLAARRKAERDAANRRRRIISGAVGAVIGLAAIVIGFMLITNHKDSSAASSPTPTATAAPTGPPTKTGTVTAQAQPAATVACGGTRPAAADAPKPQFDHAPSSADVLKPNVTYRATIQTSCGAITVQLDPKTSPETVASFVFLGTRASRLARHALMMSGLLCLVGLAGPMSGSMIWQNVAVLGYAILLPIAAVLVARVFLSTPPHGSIAH